MRRTIAIALTGGAVATAAILALHEKPSASPDRRGVESRAALRATEQHPGRPDLVALDDLDPSSPDAVDALGALRRAAEIDAASALAKARACRGPLRLAALVAALEGAAAHPAEARQRGAALLRDEPALAADCGTVLVGALIRVTAFGEACEFARNGPVELQAAWLTDVFTAWASHDTEAAAEIAASLARESGGEHILRPVLDRWATRAPEAAARFALGLPSSPARHAAVETCLARWAAIDPAAMAAALPALADPAERDTALATFICGTDTLTRSTATALALASQIEDGPLHARAMAHVLREWAGDEPRAPRWYATTHPAPADDHRPISDGPTSADTPDP